MERCTLCRQPFDTFYRATLIQEDPELRAQRQEDDEGSWDWLPMGSNGMHYMLLHDGCFAQTVDTIRSSGRSAGFMVYIGSIEDLKEVALCLN